MGRREFLDRLIKIAGGSAAAFALLPTLENNQARAQTIADDDQRIKTGYMEYKGESGKMRAYLAKPRKIKADIPGVVVIHENKGLHPLVTTLRRQNSPGKERLNSSVKNSQPPKMVEN